MKLKSSLLTFHYSKIAYFVSAALLTNYVSAAQVRDDINYQYFRDFAENKGAFTIGATNIPIVDKQGNTVGIMMKDIPMPDMKAANRIGAFTTLIDPAFLTSAKHNGGYSAVQFGGEDINPDSHYFNYLLVNRNNHPEEWQGQKYSYNDTDYHIPRLHKMVTEVTPAAYADFLSKDKNKNYQILMDRHRFPVFVRVGSGLQEVVDISTNPPKITQVGSYYQYPIGGTSFTLSNVDHVDIFAYGSEAPDGTRIQNKAESLYQSVYGPMVTYAKSGDSGSALLGYDAQQKKWVVVGVARAAGLYSNFWSLTRPDFIKYVQDQANAGTIHNTQQGQQWEWKGVDNAPEQSVISDQQGHTLSVNLRNAQITKQDSNSARPSLDYGKSVWFDGVDGGVLRLKHDINQGAGALYFNSNFTVQPETTQTWLGGGISIAKNKTVTWQVANPAGDRLSKLGEGTLLVQGKGRNLGDISVGDGVVILDQQADENGQKQAFNQLGIVSGRPTVVLKSADQIDPNKLYFGFRGGRLDLNGQALSLKRIQHTDDGATIVNHSEQPANLTITGVHFTAQDLTWGYWGKGGFDIYEYINPYANKRKDYLALKENGNAWSYYPTNQQSTEHWEYLGSDRDAAIKTIIDRKNAQSLVTAFAGHLGEKDRSKPNGELNVIYQPVRNDSTLLLSGGMNLNGEFTIAQGEVLFEGAPTPYAVAVDPKNANNKREVIYQDDWIDRTYQARRINVNGQLTVGRNVAALTADIDAKEQAVVNLGYQTGQKVCLRSDYTGKVSCEIPTYAEQTLVTIPRMQMAGDVLLASQSRLNLGKTDFYGSIQGDLSSQTNLAAESHWHLTGDSQLGDLHLAAGSKISLSQPDQPFHTLTINGNLSGNGTFFYRSQFATVDGDKVIVNGTASGNHQLYLNDIGTEPERNKARLTLMEVAQQSDDFSLTLHNNYVDIGAYRYQLIQDGKLFRLYNPIVEAEIAEEERQAEQARQAAEAQRLAEAQRQAEQARQAVEAQRLAEAQRQAEQARQAVEAQRLAEAQRQAEQARQTAEAQWLAEEQQKKTQQPKNLPTGLKQAQVISRLSNTALSDLSAQVNLLLQHDQQLAQLNLQEPHQQALVWNNTKVQKDTYHSDNYRAYQQHSTYTELGVESGINDQHLSFGTVVSRSHARNDYDQASGKSVLTQVTGYGKFYHPQGLFMMTDLSYGRSTQRVNMESERVDFHRNILSIGVAIGQKWAFDAFDFKTAAGMRYHRLSAADYPLKGAKIHTNKLEVVNYHLDAALSKSWYWDTFSMTPSFTVRYFDASHKKFDHAITIDKVNLHQQFASGWQYQLGNEINLGAWTAAIMLTYENGRESFASKQLGIKIGYQF